MHFDQLPPEITFMILENLDKMEDLISYSRVNKRARSFCVKRKQKLLEKYTFPLYALKYKKRKVVQIINNNMKFIDSYSCPACLSTYTTYSKRSTPIRGCIKNCADCKRPMCTNIKLDNYCHREPINDRETRGSVHLVTYRCRTCRKYEHSHGWQPREFTDEEKKVKEELLKTVSKN
jgi:hypothetical protein